MLVYWSVYSISSQLQFEEVGGMQVCDDSDQFVLCASGVTCVADLLTMSVLGLFHVNLLPLMSKASLTFAPLLLSSSVLCLALFSNLVLFQI